MIRKVWFSMMLSASSMLFCHAHSPEKLENIIQSITLEKNAIGITINEAFKQRWLTSDFFARYEKDINLKAMPLSIALLPFILNIYPVVWISGRSYSIDCMDEDTYHSLEKIKQVLQRLYPNTPLSGNLVPKKLEKNKPSVPLVNSNTHVAILYSAGLDSTACSFQHWDKHQLLISAQGQGDLPVKKMRLWARRKAILTQYAQERGYKNAFVSSNYSEFLNWTVLDKVSKEIISWRVDTTEGIGLFGVAAPILFAKGYSTLLAGSSFVWDYPYPTAANPLMDDNLVAATSLRLKHEHFDLTRFDKIKLIVDLVKNKGLKKPFMKVCDHKQGTVNCCRHCAKCQTVMNSLFVLGEDPAHYGFNVTPDQIVERTKAYFSTRQGYWTCWNFCDIRQKLQQLPKVPEKARWMLDFNFMRKASYHMAGAKTRVDWQAFKDLAPDSLTIPETIVPKGCDSTEGRRQQEQAQKNYTYFMIQKKKQWAARQKNR